jgi:hypothetical protein
MEDRRLASRSRRVVVEIDGSSWRMDGSSWRIGGPFRDRHGSSWRTGDSSNRCDDRPRLAVEWSEAARRLHVTRVALLDEVKRHGLH